MAEPNALLENDQGFQARAMLMQINNDHLRYLSQLCMTRINLRFAVGGVQGEIYVGRFFTLRLGSLEQYIDTGKDGRIFVRDA